MQCAASTKSTVGKATERSGHEAMTTKRAKKAKQVLDAQLEAMLKDKPRRSQLPKGAPRILWSTLYICNCGFHSESHRVYMMHRAPGARGGVSCVTSRVVRVKR